MTTRDMTTLDTTTLDTTTLDTTTWTVRFDVPPPYDGQLRVAVKDAIDMVGVPTFAGCAAVRDRAVPAERDAACLAGIRASDAVIVGKAAQTELCMSPTGVNRTFGTPVNPLAPDRIPGGSSSGSAVAVAGGEADIALGTDTGGSVRIPAACCGIVGLKTTWGRVSIEGIWPLAPTLDTVGPIARDVAGVVTGMRLLEPGFTVAAQPARVIGRIRIEGDADDPYVPDAAIEDAVDAALAAAGFTVRTVELPGWDASFDAFDGILLSDFWQCHHALLDAEGLSRSLNDTLRHSETVTTDQRAAAIAGQHAWRAEVAAALDGVDLLALPTLVGPPPKLTEVKGFPATYLTAPFNVAGVPALAMPVPSPGLEMPASLQLVAPAGGEELLCATALMIEKALQQ